MYYRNASKLWLEIYLGNTVIQWNSNFQDSKKCMTKGREISNFLHEHQKHISTTHSNTNSWWLVKYQLQIINKPKNEKKTLLSWFTYYTLFYECHNIISKCKLEIAFHKIHKTNRHIYKLCCLWMTFCHNWHIALHYITILLAYLTATIQLMKQWKDPHHKPWYTYILQFILWVS